MVEQTHEAQLVNLSQKPLINSYIRSKQSANVLFKFMGKLDYLKEVLLNMAIIPRYYEEKINYLQIDGIEKIAFPMSCFCDIHLNKLESHAESYGSYGIGLNKDWGIDAGIQPIHYINPNSKLRKELSLIISKALNQASKEDRDKLEIYNNLILHKLFFMKPLQGDMISSGQYITKNFHDEKEWRFIPDFNEIDTELPMVIDSEQMNLKSYNSYSLGITTKEELWLKFNSSAIKHIIVKNQSDRKELIEFITEKQIGDNEYDRSLLFSKIVVFDEMKEDM